MTIPLTDATDLLATIRQMRKSLRDVRDRAARIDPTWSAMALAGMVGGNHLVIVVQHVGIERDALWTTLERRWPEAIVSEFKTVEPRSSLSVETTVQLAVQRRGIEPIRVVVPAQIRGCYVLS